MPILLFRVDERLIHGQVVIGWASQLGATRFLVVDDDLADSAWEQELYLLGLPEGAVAVFASVEGAQEELTRWKGEETRSVLLTRDIGTMRRLGERDGLRGERVNLGGLHHAPGRTQALSYVHLSPQDRRDLRELRRQGARVVARDVPSSAGIDLDALLEKGSTDPEEG